MTDIEQARKAGQDEAWETARKIFCQYKEEDMIGLFGLLGSIVFPWIDTAQEAIRKIKEYEKVAVGDEVKKDGIVFVVTGENDHFYYGFDAEGNIVFVLKDNTVKTGRHYDIQTILDDMKGDG